MLRVLWLVMEDTRSSMENLRGCWKRNFLRRQSFRRKKFWINFSRLFENEGPQGTVPKGPQGNLIKIVQAMRWFFNVLRRRQKQIYKKRLPSGSKTVLTIFFRETDYGIRQETVYWAPQGNMAITVQVIKSSL